MKTKLLDLYQEKELTRNLPGNYDQGFHISYFVKLRNWQSFFCKFKIEIGERIWKKYSTDLDHRHSAQTLNSYRSQKQFSFYCIQFLISHYKKESAYRPKKITLSNPYASRDIPTTNCLPRSFEELMQLNSWNKLRGGANKN